MTAARNAASPSRFQWLVADAASCCNVEANWSAKPSTWKNAETRPYSLPETRSSKRSKQSAARYQHPASIGGSTKKLSVLRRGCFGAGLCKPPSLLLPHAATRAAANEFEETFIGKSSTSASTLKDEEAESEISPTTFKRAENSMSPPKSAASVHDEPASTPITELRAATSARAQETADSSSGATTNKAGPMWVRDSRGVLRRAGYQGTHTSSRASKGVQKASPSQRRLPRHGPQRAAAVVQMLYDSDLTTDAVLDQLAAAIQKAELNMIIKDLGKKGRANKALQVFEWMLQQDKQHTPDEITFSSMITVLHKHSQMQRARELFDMMEKVGCRRNAYIYNALLSGYAKSGAAQEALQLFERMKREGVQPDESSYNVLINACGRGRQLLQAVVLFQEMQGRGLQPSAVTYTTLVGAFGKHNRPYQALRTFQEALEAGVTPDRPLFNSLLDALARGNLYDEVGKVHRKMTAQGFAPSLDAYYSMLASYKRGGRSAEAHAVLDEMLKAGLDPGPVSLPSRP